MPSPPISGPLKPRSAGRPGPAAGYSPPNTMSGLAEMTLVTTAPKSRSFSLTVSVPRTLPPFSSNRLEKVSARPWP